MPRQEGVWFAGDLHGGFPELIRCARDLRPAAIILMGDIEAPAMLDEVLAPLLEHTEPWWIVGNHDTDSPQTYDHLFKSRLADRNLHGRVVDIAGYRIAGLGGVFRKQVWMPPQGPKFESPRDYLDSCGKGNWWRGGLPLRHRSTIFRSDMGFALAERADILVCHEAPSCHPHGIAAIDELARTLGVRRVFHGHHHQLYVQPDTGLGFSTVGTGLRGIVDVSGEIVFAGEK
ncbi:metallophosphoesterase family protein [Silvimonas amylolytica]|uniref:Calcineurin-like phosphoesterase domain-containing protein n=1 Tax=Silvimonas amylolytica TaxID=449663 RepID=A0ABQ2PNB3_9NEIS|nr:metallophosphoesterase [Silvimonas amylolytica]GGP26813.1 hypothetical protein GCM10010971_26320 [Silvimonas amylolytica]